MSNQKSDNIKLTIKFWREYLNVNLPSEEARESVKNLVGFFETLNKWNSKELNSENKNEVKGP